MNRIAVVLLAVTSWHSTVIAQEGSERPSTNDDKTVQLLSQLIGRIEQLQKRVEELEEKLHSLPRSFPQPQYQPYNAPYSTPGTLPSQPQPSIPNAVPQRPPQPATPYSAPAVPYQPTVPYQPAPFQPAPNQFAPTPGEEIPDSWQPFYFNGQRYYIIPLDEANRVSRSK